MEKEFKIGWGWRHVRMWPAQRRLKLDSGTWSPKGSRQVLLIDEHALFQYPQNAWMR
jgi:hypothetical protein